MEARQFRSSRRRGGVRVAAVDEQNVVSGWRQKLYRPQGCAPIYSLEVSTHPRSATMTLFYQPELLYMTNQSVSSCMGMNGIVDPSHSVAVVVVCMRTGPHCASGWSGWCWVVVMVLVAVVASCVRVRVYCL